MFLNKDKYRVSTKQALKQILLSMLYLSVVYLFIFLISFPVDFFRNDNERISFNDLDQAIILESKYPLGSIFNKDQLTFGLKEFIILKRSFIGEKKISLPFSRIDKLVLTDGLCWNSLEIIP